MICHRCGSDSPHKARGLCGRCYEWLRRHKDQREHYPKVRWDHPYPYPYCRCPDGTPIERLFGGLAIQCAKCYRKVFASDEPYPKELICDASSESVGRRAPPERNGSATTSLQRGRFGSSRTGKTAGQPSRSGTSTAASAAASTSRAKS